MISIVRCGNKYDQKSRIQITDSDMEAFCEQVEDKSKNLKSNSNIYIIYPLYVKI